MLRSRIALVSILVITSFTLAFASSTVNFSAARSVPAYISQVSASAIADLNGDGKNDIVVAGVSEVRVLLGTGDGLFALGDRHFVGSDTGFDRPPRQIRLVDVNRDGKLDIVVNHYETNRVVVLLGRGDGTFGAAVGYRTCVGPRSIAVADFNRDGKPDIAVFCTPDTGDSLPVGRIAILAGNGNGSFQAPVDRAPASGNIEAADFNHDGAPDLVSGGSVLLGRGDGSFSLPRVIATGSLVVVGDFNKDGNQDFATSFCPDECFSVYTTVGYGHGDGTFQVAAIADAGPGQVAGIAAGDFNGDSTVDLAILKTSISGSDFWLPGSLSIARGLPDGTFDLQLGSVLAASVNLAAAAGDLNGDGIADLVVPDNTGVEIVLGGKPAMLAPTAFDGVINFPTRTVIGDLNGDGIPDIAVAGGIAGANEDSFAVLYGRGNGIFAPKIEIPGSYEFVGIGDLDGKGGANDLVLSRRVESGPGILDVFLRINDRYILKERHSHGGPFVIADFTGDGKMDIATASGWLLVNRGDGTFSERFVFTPGNDIAVADFNRDGKKDVAIIGDQLQILLGDGKGRFLAGPRYSSNAGFSSLAVADFNGDGLPDVVTSPAANVWFSRGDGTLQGPVSAQPLASGDMAVADFNGDGRPDLAVNLPGYWVAQANVVPLGVLLNDGHGAFAAPARFSTADFLAPSSIAAGDLNKDGFADIVVTTQGFLLSEFGVVTGSIHVLTNSTGTWVKVATSGNPGSGVLNLLATVRPSIELPYAPTGTVAFYDGNTVIGTATLRNGSAQLSGVALRSGTHRIKAKYSGNRVFNLKWSTTLVQTIR